MARSRDEMPEGFTLSLALVDALPVVLFCLSAVVLGSRLASPVFVAGAVVALAGGAGKVAWKLLIALARRNVRWLSRQMRYVMPVGFALMVVGLVLRASELPALLGGLVRMPSVVFLVAWVACMVAMGYLAGHRNQNDAHGNWIEQGINSLGQACLLVALLLGA